MSFPGPLTITIPGEPVGHGRPRAASTGGGRVRGVAQVHMQAAMEAAGLNVPAFGEQLVELEVLAVFPCPKSHWKKRVPLARRPYGGRRDWDNLAKAVGDAGNGVLWLDDAQVWRGTVARVYGAQGEAPHVRVRVFTFGSWQLDQLAAL